VGEYFIIIIIDYVISYGRPTLMAAQLCAME